MKRVLKILVDTFGAMTPGRRMALLLAVAAVAVGGTAYQRASNRTDWAVLYANLDDAAASETLVALDEAGIAYRLEAGGSRIDVPRDQLARTRLAMAAEGKGGAAVPVGYELLDSQGLATNDFKQRIDYQRALEGELAKTLLSMDPITSATVHVTLPERPLYATTDDTVTLPTASVLVGHSRPLADDEVSTILNLVASSVENLTPGNVTVASTDGVVLHAPGDAATSSDSSNQAVRATQEFEANLSTELTALVQRFSGRPDASAVVRAELDFSETSIESETIDPDKRVPTADKTVTETWTDSGAAAAGTTTATSGDYSKQEQTATYTGDRTITRTVQGSGDIVRMSVAVVVPVAEDETIDVDALNRVVSAAAGLDAERGDMIEVATVPAAVVAENAAVDPDVAPPAGGLPIPMIAGGAAGLFVVMFVLRGRKKKKAAAGAPGAPSVIGGSSPNRVPTSAELDAHLAAASADAAAEEIRTDLAKMATQTPESLAALLSNWLSKP
jgi:flagellar M-ring protein FliF